MILQVAFQEIRYILRQRLFWLLSIIGMAILIWLFHRGVVFVGTLLEGEQANSPQAVAANAIIFSMVGLLALFPLFNGAALREHQYGFTEVLFSAPLHKSSLYIGRFGGALAIGLLLVFFLLFCNEAGVRLGLLLGRIAEEEAAPFRPGTFLEAFFFFLLPNLLICGSLVFGAAHFGKSSLAGLLVLLMLLSCYLLSVVVGGQLENFWLGALADPFGGAVLDLAFRHMPAAERNHSGLSWTGYLVMNRLCWAALGTLALLAGYRYEWRKRRRSVPLPPENFTAPTTVHLRPAPQGVFNARAKGRQFAILFRNAFRWLARGLPFRLLLLGQLAFLGVDLLYRSDQYGIKTHPLTYEMIERAGDYRMFLLLCFLFITSELLWRERQLNTVELIDATPHPAGWQMMAKALAAILAFFLGYAFLLLLLAAFQLASGYHHIRWSWYAIELLVYTLPLLIFWASFFLFLQSLLRHKYLAYAIGVLVFVGQSFLWKYLDWESNLVRFGKMGTAALSDFNGYRPFLSGNIGFGIYWSLMGACFLWAAAWLWGRGLEDGLLVRLREALAAQTRRTLLVGGLLMTACGGLGGYLYYHTHILNHYASAGEKLALKAAYEKAYKHFERAPQPQVTKARFFIGLFPEERQLDARTELVLANRSSQPLDSLCFTTRSAYNNNGWQFLIEVEGARVVWKDTVLGFQIFELQVPLMPGDSMDVHVYTNFRPCGIENEVSNTDIVPNGTFLNIWDFLPHQGYLPGLEIRNEEDRKQQGLAPRQTSHYTAYQNYLYPYAGWIDMETFITTRADQIAIAPGALVREWQEGQRRHFYYKPARPCLFFLSFVSGRYQVARRKWKGIGLEVYHHPAHAEQAGVMLDGMERSLAYCTEHFGPYPFKVARIVEFPRYASFAAAFPGTMPYSEAKGFVLDYQPGRGHNVILSSVAHEMAHQWWGHQAMPANLSGKSMLTESLAEYTALMIMKEAATQEQMMDFLQYDYEDYLRRRTRYSREEPLWKADEQSHVYYRKGSIVMYALQEQIGEAAVNRALRNYLERYRYEEAPYPQSTDFLEILRCEMPDSLQYLIQDQFLDVTFLRHRIDSAFYEKRPDGRYSTTAYLSVVKQKAGPDGQLEQVPTRGRLDIGLYDETGAVIGWRKLALGQKKIALEFITEEKPGRLKADPLLLHFNPALPESERAPKPR